MPARNKKARSEAARKANVTRKRRNAAAKAVKTRKARTAFMTKYGFATYMVAAATVSGKKKMMPSIDKMSIAAVKANITRGTYDKYLPDCNFKNLR
jgi:hypothetical protein